MCQIEIEWFEADQFIISLRCIFEYIFNNYLKNDLFDVKSLLCLSNLIDGNINQEHIYRIGSRRNCDLFTEYK